MNYLKYTFWLTLMIAGFAFSAWNNSVFAQTGKQKAGVTYDANITRVIDGDTVAFEAAWLPDPLKKELSIRVFGVDTPEKGHRAQCPQEDARGQAASKFTKDMIAASQKRQVVLMDWDKYGGRVLGDVILNGQSLRMMLISKGYAREYYGEAKTSWCN
jgi:endonuclease YncB( thermonuclease family)